MNILGIAGAMLAMASSTVASAQATDQAFECLLPYKPSMEAMAAMTVKEQRSDPGLQLLEQGPSEIVEFEPGDTLVFGETPSALLLTMQQPATNAKYPKYKITFEARFPRVIEVDEAIIDSNSWHLGICENGISLCIRDRETKPEGSGELRYRRDRSEFLQVECIFEFTEEEFAALE